jgi:predicted nucleic acid-binding Zn ribbon protein
LESAAENTYNRRHGAREITEGEGFLNDHQGPARRRVRKIGSLVSQLMSRKGYAQSAANEELLSAITASVGPELVSSIQVGNLRQGTLQIFARDSVTLQELNFQKRAILRKIQKDLPQANIADLRFRIES